MRNEEQVTIAILALDHELATGANAMVVAQIAARKAALEWVTGRPDPIISPLTGEK